VLREAALGELGADIGVAADETLIATGLEGGDIEIAVTAQDTIFELPAELEVTHHQPSRLPEEDYVEQDTRIMEPIPAEDEIRITATDWLDEVTVDESTLDFPAIENDVSHRERVDTPRVRHLFPVPEDADWEVRELKYDHYRRAG
jgi:hypothetical protein